MNKIFVTSDIWFNRPYGKMSEYNTHEYNDIIISNWNKTVGKKDIVYVLGGIGVSDMYHILLKLNGEIHILNNFFTQDEIFFRDVIIESLNKSVDKNIMNKIIFEDSQMMILPEQDIVLSYLPLMNWYGSETGTYTFHGFSHKSDLSNNRICCSMEFWNYKPILISEIQTNLKKIRKNI